MKIKRFFAPDMRQAIRQVRETLGADAVILSNKSVEGGVELIAAMDYDETEWSDTTQPAAKVTTQRPKAADGGSDGRQDSLHRFEPRPTDPPGTPAAGAKTRPSVDWSQDPILVEMRKEMRVIRRMMENELSGLGWRDLGEHKAGAQELLRRLMKMGFTAELCHRVLERIRATLDTDRAWEEALQCLAQELKVAENKLLEQGGVVAVVGPTGVGKTTSVAKLAARFCLRHGTRHLALISTDNFRIGAREQLHDYARILDVPVRTATSEQELHAALNAFADKRLVLIDTAGMSQQDARLGEQLSLLSSRHQPVQCLLTLSASTQQSSMMLAIKAFATAKPHACILTKVDETATLGGALSALIQTRLPVAFTTDGQRVPEDLQIARSRTLISQAVSMAEQDELSYSDEYIAIALGGAAGYAHV